MKRMQLVVAALAIVVTSLAAFGGPAMADDWNRNDDFFDNGFFFGGNGFGDFEQEAESGDVDQSFEVTGSGDNSYQTVGGQGVANTGNAQNQIRVFDAGNGFEDDLFFDDDNRFFFDDHFFNDDDGDFEFDDVGSSIEVSPTNTTSSDQEVNQAATATRYGHSRQNRGTPPRHAYATVGASDSLGKTTDEQGGGMTHADPNKMASSRSFVRLGLGIGIFVLTPATALIHLYLGLGIGNTLFVLNGLGYLGLLAALQLPIPQLGRFRNVVRWALVAYTALTIVLWFIMAPFYSVIGYADKAVEAVLIALLVADAYLPVSSERTSLTYEDSST